MPHHFSFVFIMSTQHWAEGSDGKIVVIMIASTSGSLTIEFQKSHRTSPVPHKRVFREFCYILAFS